MLWKILLIVYIVGALPAEFIWNKLLHYNLPRSIHDDHMLGNLTRAAIDATAVWIGLINLATWPLNLIFWGIISVTTWRRRRRVQAGLSVPGRLPDGFDSLREAHRLMDPPCVAVTVVVTVVDEDGTARDGFCHYLKKDKINEKLASTTPLGEWLQANIDAVRDPTRENAVAMTSGPPDVLAVDPTRPRLTLVKQEDDATGLNGLWFFVRIRPMAHDPLVLNLVADTPYACLPLFPSADEKQLKDTFGADAKEIGVVPMQINDPMRFLQSLPVAVGRPVRIVKNVKKTSDGKWTFDTICEVSPRTTAGVIVTSRDAGPETRPPAA